MPIILVVRDNEGMFICKSLEIKKPRMSRELNTYIYMGMQILIFETVKESVIISKSNVIINRAVKRIEH